jgi:hypothetical protein
MLTQVTQALLEDFAESVIAGIQKNIRTKQVTEFGPMYASGKMSDSLDYRIDAGGLTIYSSEKYFTVLETGRKPGKRPPISVIEKWIRTKPVASEMNPRSLAFLIARKIGEKGSLLYRQGGRSGVISDEINDKVLQEKLIDVIGVEFRNYVINEFINKSVRE